MPYDLERMAAMAQQTDVRSPERKNAYNSMGPRDLEFSFLSMRDLPERGEWLIRFLPSSPDKNPKGFVELVQHWIDPHGNGTDKFPVECLAPQQPCYICDFLTAMLPVLPQLAPNVREAVGRMEYLAQLLYVISINLPPKSVEIQVNGAPKTVTKWGPEKEGEHGAILQVYRDNNSNKPDANPLSPLAWAIRQNLSAMPDAMELATGRYFSLIKNAKNQPPQLAVSSGPCEFRDMELLQKYPNMLTRPYSKSFMRASYGEMETVIAGTWLVNLPIVQQVMQQMRAGPQVYSESRGLVTEGPPPVAFQFGPAPQQQRLPRQFGDVMFPPQQQALPQQAMPAMVPFNRLAPTFPLDQSAWGIDEIPF